MANAVIRVAGNLVLWQCAEKDIAGNGGGGLLLAGNLESHRSMQTHDPSTGYNIEQYGDVAMTDNPFGMLLIIFEGDAV